MGRFIIVDDKHKDDGYRRDEMRHRMNGYYRMGDYRNADYDEGYRTGYDHGYRDHEHEMMGGESYRRSRYGM